MKIVIEDYKWEILFVAKETIQGNDGQTRCNDFQILVRNDLNPTARAIVLTHEICHAILDTQGRAFQRKFDVEELCEFIAWKRDAINEAVEYIERCLEENPQYLEKEN